MQEKRKKNIQQSKIDELTFRKIVAGLLIVPPLSKPPKNKKKKSRQNARQES